MITTSLVISKTNTFVAFFKTKNEDLDEKRRQLGHNHVKRSFKKLFT
jgi:hypothetical protein